MGQKRLIHYAITREAVADNVADLRTVRDQAC